MAKSKYTVEEVFQVAMECQGNLAEAARRLGFTTRSVVYHRLKHAGLLSRLRQSFSAGSTVTKSAMARVASNKEKIDVRPTKSGLAIDYLGTKIQTEEELLKDAGIDMELYEVERCVVNNWEVAGAKKNKDQDDSLWKDRAATDQGHSSPKEGRSNCSGAVVAADFG